MTVAVARVLRIFLDDVAAPRYGYDLMRHTGFASGKLYPILARLERAGWLVREREDVEATVQGRPVRYFYRLNPSGLEEVRYQMAELSRQLQPSDGPAAALRPEGGLT